ncbi:MAG: putative toxin-antitoxin system toxin component, PIN family [Chitinophagaceae bacterium]
MTVVLDCNILVMCISSKSDYHIIYQNLVNGNYTIAITDEILLEYEEIIERKFSIATAKTFMALLSELSNVKFTSVYYKWFLIDADPDDNKYVDCAIASNADFIVTEDHHFNSLTKISFPKVKSISINDFMTLVSAT